MPPLLGSIGETFPLARTIHEGLEDELSWVWPRLDGGDTLSASAALTANPGYLQLQRGYVGGSDSEVAPRAELKELAATNLLVRSALSSPGFVVVVVVVVAVVVAGVGDGGGGGDVDRGGCGSCGLRG